ncbi:family 20 glycosylhydrolase [Streptomyces sp. NBC_00996]|uniref:family 20 glycosylhydrolase n=1 Tax=Streptomyces sp. NBC_00996 TaxID=2903710 RepID=UPI00386516AB|nr:family 20 glycosylhydrolase [Streptomyces sp. NBC_00996]
MDVTKPATLTLVTNLLKEFVPLFPNSPVFHIGDDEYPYLDQMSACPDLVACANANAKGHVADVFVNFVNDLNKVVTGLGRKTEIWNWWDEVGGNTIQPAKDIIIEGWKGDTSKYTNDGYEAVSRPESKLYVTPGLNTQPNTSDLYSTWAPSTAAGLDGYEVDVWADGWQDKSDAYFDWYLRRPREVAAGRTVADLRLQPHRRAALAHPLVSRTESHAGPRRDRRGAAPDRTSFATRCGPGVTSQATRLPE